MKPEDSARKNIDRQLEAAGWCVQDRKNLNFGADLGVAIREFSLKSGLADYALFVNRKLVGVVEAKPEGTTLSGVAEQSQKYLTGVPENLPHAGDTLPLPTRLRVSRRSFEMSAIRIRVPDGYLHFTSLKSFRSGLKRKERLERGY